MRLIPLLWVHVRRLLTFLQISGNGLVQYYLHSVLLSIGITSVATQTTINGCLAIYNFVIAVGASFFVEKIGRRKLFIISTAGMFFAFILWTTFAACKYHSLPRHEKGAGA
jgi:MFS family permease